VAVIGTTSLQERLAGLCQLSLIERLLDQTRLKQAF
jgi:hypothetical protein